MGRKPVTRVRYNLRGLREAEAQRIRGGADLAPGPPEVGVKAVKLDPEPS